MCHIDATLRLDILGVRPSRKAYMIELERLEDFERRVLQFAQKIRLQREFPKVDPVIERQDLCEALGRLCERSRQLPEKESEAFLYLVFNLLHEELLVFHGCIDAGARRKSEILSLHLKQSW